MKTRTVASRVVGAALSLLWGCAGCGRPQHSPEPAATAPAAVSAKQESAKDNGGLAQQLSPPAAEPAREAAADSEAENDLLQAEALKRKAGAPGRSTAERKKGRVTLDLPHDDSSLVAGLDEARDDFRMFGRDVVLLAKVPVQIEQLHAVDLWIADQLPTLIADGADHDIPADRPDTIVEAVMTIMPPAK